MDQKVVFAFILAFIVVQWVVNKVMAWFDNLEWRKDLRERARAKIEAEEQAMEKSGKKA